MKKTFGFLVIILVTYACNFGGAAIYDNNSISPKIKKEIGALNVKFYEAIKNKDEKTIKELLTPELLEKISKNETLDIDGLFKGMESFHNFSTPLVVDGFQTKGTANVAISIPSQITKTKDYSINFISPSSESYISLVQMQGERGHCALFTFIYGKHEDQWKLSYFHIGNYSLHNQIAPQYYEKANSEYNNGNLINAFINIYLASSIIKPGGEIFHYNISPEIDELDKKIMDGINTNYKFPIILNVIDTQPEIFGIHIQEIESSFSPMVNYITKINLNDTVSLRLENEKIKKVISNYFKGINDNNDFVCYRAYNKIPTDSTAITYGFVHVLK